jgi:trimeric autotransporter adhesin
MPGDGHWDRQFGMPGTSTRNFALRWNNNKLYTGGYSLSGGQTATNTVVWVFDGANWSTLGDITGGTTVLYDFGFLGNDVYVGGSFNRAGGVSAGGLARWNGTNWSGVGGFTGFVAALASDGTNLYVGGSFTNCGGIFTTNLAKWNGSSWAAVGGGIGFYDSPFSQAVNALAWHNGHLYAGGAFANAGSVAATNLASWDGSTWSQVGGGVPGTGGIFSGNPVSTLAFLANDLYVGGNFTTVGNGVPALNVAKWNGSAWSALGSGLKAAPNKGPVGGLAALGSAIYATGNFTNAGGLSANVAKWDGANWSSLGAINGTGTRAAADSSSVYISGLFNVANYNTSSNVIGNNVLRWDGAAWHGVDGRPSQGTHIFVQALATGTDGLYMGGVFNVVGTTTAAHVARWDGTSWWPLGSGVTGTYGSTTLTVRALKAMGSQVLVGGGFVYAGGGLANNVAVWDPSGVWYPLGSGVDNSVNAVETGNGYIFAGGTFINATDWTGTYTVNHIAFYDPATAYWWGLTSGTGIGVNGTVNALAYSSGWLYAGGSFTTAGSTTANRIAYFDGTSWYSLGTGTANGLNGTVNAILVDGATVYVGGAFTTAGGNTAPAIAKWSGGGWSSVGQGMFHTSTASVTALAKSGNYLYATGYFTNAGGSVVTRNIARWDGANWTALGSGIGVESTPGASRGSALAVSGNDLFVGGTFETAGVSDSGYLARWNDQIDFTPPSLLRLTGPQMLAGNNFRFRATANQGAAYVIEYSTNLTGWFPLATNGWPWLDVTDSVAGVKTRTYRMRQIP